MTINPSTRRVNQRHEVQLPVRIEVNGIIRESEISNMSVGGLYIVDDFEYSNQQIIKVYFSIPTLNEEMEVESVIRWVEKNADGGVAGIGIQFIGLKAKQVWGMTKYFASLTAAQTI
ncbi:MAG: PilZ domain-containing protein [Deltaproteobacteria bacterium]|nr:PilZ domain-containing protein [Deltaproteobacteria bacterium]